MRHPRHHQVVERRHCAGTGPLQHDFIHGTVMLPNSDAGFRWVLSPVLAKHIATYCVSFVTFLHEHEAITTPSQNPGRAALRGENGRSPRKAPPGQRSIESFYVFHERDGAARPSLQVTSRLARHDYVYMFCGRWFCFPRWDGGGGCAWAPARGHRCWRSGWTLSLTKDTSVCNSLWVMVSCVCLDHPTVFRRVAPGCRAWAAAPGLLRLGCIIEGHLLGSYQDTRRNLMFSNRSGFVTRSALNTCGSALLIILDCGFCSVLLAFFRFAFDSITESHSFLFLHMLMSSIWMVLAFALWYFVFPKVLLPADDISAYEYLLTLRIF